MPVVERTANLIRKAYRVATLPLLIAGGAYLYQENSSLRDQVNTQQARIAVLEENHISGLSRATQTERALSDINQRLDVADTETNRRFLLSELSLNDRFQTITRSTKYSEAAGCIAISLAETQRGGPVFITQERLDKCQQRVRDFVNTFSSQENPERTTTTSIH